MDALNDALNDCFVCINRPSGAFGSHNYEISSLLQINSVDVFLALEALDCKKSSGPDGIDSLFLKIYAPFLSYPLTIIFNKLLESWKVWFFQFNGRTHLSLQSIRTALRVILRAIDTFLSLI